MEREEQQDLIKKRTKGKYNSNFGAKDCYLKYISGLDKQDLPFGTNYKDTSYDIKFTLYKQIVKDLNKKVIEALILKNYEFTIPFRMGELSVKKRKTKVRLDENGNVLKSKLPVDYKATKELWAIDPQAKEEHIKIYLFNEHFDGYRCLFYWKKRDINTSGIKPYCFRPTREHKRNLAFQIKNNPDIEFYEN